MITINLFIQPIRVSIKKDRTSNLFNFLPKWTNLNCEQNPDGVQPVTRLHITN